MARLVPILLGFAVGFFLAMTFFGGRGSRRKSSDSSEWEEKYRDLYDRYRDLTRELNKPSAQNPENANELRQGLWRVRSILGEPDEIDSERATAALMEIDLVLEKTVDRDS